MKSFILRFEETVKSCWEQPALNDYRHDTLRYADLAAEIETLHLLWREAGLGPGDKVALNAHSSSNWITAFMAAVTGGFVGVQLFNGYTPRDTQHLVDHSDSKILYTEKSIFDKMDFEAMPQLLGAIDMKSGELLAARGSFAGLYARRRELFAARHPEGLRPEETAYADRPMDDVCGINYTSGSTGNPKGVMLTVGNFSANVDAILRRGLPYRRGERYLSILPLAHIFGLTVDGILPLCVGMHLTILCVLPIPSTLKAALCEVRPRLLFAVPLMLSKMVEYTIGEFIHSRTGEERLAHASSHPDFCEALRTIFMAAFGGRCEMIITGGAAIPPELERLLAFTLRVSFATGYGMTECAPVISIGHPNRYKLKSCGECLEEYEIRINSKDPLNIAGELWVKGPCVFAGYYKNPDATAAAFTEEGWFRTGDLGTIDADRTLFLVGRCKHMILSANGQNIFPEEIEVLLNQLPYVAESLIVPRENRLIALIVPKQEQLINDSIDNTTLREIMNRNIVELNQQIPQYSQVADYELQSEAFAKTPKGSIKRFMYS